MPIYIFHHPSGREVVNLHGPDHEDQAVKYASEHYRSVRVEFAPTGEIIWSTPPTEPPQPVYRFKFGDSVRKVSGYRFEGEVRAAFTARSGQIRYAVELVSGGNGDSMLHIFSETQLEERKS
jgi:hypothetical protein